MIQQKHYKIELSIYAIIILLLCNSCENYSSKPYDEWENKLRETKAPSKLKRMVIKEGWQKYDSLSYLRFSNLEEIFLETDSIPAWIIHFENLKMLVSYKSDIRHIPEDIHKLKNLECIDISGGEIETIPFSIKKLKHLKSLIIDENRITHIPQFLTELDTLHLLSLCGNNISVVPDYICQINGLKSLMLSDNKLTSLPECIGNMTYLENIYLYNNQIKELPESIANLPLLTDLAISNNNISKLPEGLFTKPNKLTYLPVYQNPIEGNEQIVCKVKELIGANRQKTEQNINKKEHPNN